jgi:hypothetical protein
MTASSALCNMLLALLQDAVGIAAQPRCNALQIS